MRLWQWFEHEALDRKQTAVDWGERCIAITYQRCADDLARVLAGKTPPAPGEV